MSEAHDLSMKDFGPTGIVARTARHGFDELPAIGAAAP